MAMHYLIYLCLAVMTKATPLSAVRTIWLSFFLPLCRAFLYLLMLENVGMGLAMNFVRASLTYA